LENYGHYEVDDNKANYHSPTDRSLNIGANNETWQHDILDTKTENEKKEI
jgi:hypothetical protein